MTAEPFFILTMPRCRSAWLANLLTTDRTWCGHEACVPGGRFDPPRGYDIVGAAGSDVAHYAAEIRMSYPSARFAVVTRDPLHVSRSLRRLGIEIDVAAIDGLRRKIDEFARHAGAFRLPYDEMSPSRIMALWEWCLPGVPLRLDRLTALLHFNVQLDRLMRR